MKKITHNNKVVSARPSPCLLATLLLGLPESIRFLVLSGDRTDSGRPRSRVANRQGAAPPTMKTARQPKVLIRIEATNPPVAAPIENPVNISITHVERSRLGMYSEVSAIALGNVPPSPKPVMSRRTSIDLTEVALAVSSEKTPNQTVQKSRIVRRPNRSARGPKNNAPKSMPTRPAVRIGPNAPREMFHSAERVGATKPIACASNPSISTDRAHNDRTRR